MKTQKLNAVHVWKRSEGGRAKARPYKRKGRGEDGDVKSPLQSGSKAAALQNAALRAELLLS